MIDELEFWGARSSSGKEFPEPTETLPSLVRDVQADDARDIRRWLAHCVNELGGAVFIKTGVHLPLNIQRTERGVVLRVES